ncbi:MAG: hypothetical protein LQ350_005877 [Teloschistes chrysophthalmus]|nr:MAG: hypothetical protein LQ350_005877 [Niorma chrysophthalma]
MASTARSRISDANARPSSHPAHLPVYEPLTHTLNPAAQQALHNLPTTHSLNDLKRRLQTAVAHLTEITGDLNDQHQARKADYDKLKARKAARAREVEGSQGASNEDEEGDRRMEETSKDIEDRTAKMDEGTRRIIDVQARVEGAKTALNELDTNTIQNTTATQSTLGASQYRSRSQNQRRLGNDDDDEGDDDDNTTQRANTHIGPPALDVFKSKLSAAEATYTSLSLQDRYASHNDYIGFRKIVHDAQHPDDDTPLPHPSTWFPSSSNPSSNPNHNKNLSRTASANANGAPDSDSDPEIQIAREKRSIRCPLTLLPMTDPLTSTLCPHSFEKSAILGMLEASTLRHNPTPGARGGGEKALKCPECSILLTASTLKKDPVLIRKIRRLEEQERREEESDDDDDEGDIVGGGSSRRRAEEVTSSPVQSKGAARGVEKVKRERMSQMSRGPGTGREVSVVPDSQAGAMVIDDDEGEDEDEDEEEDLYEEEE